MKQTPNKPKKKIQAGKLIGNIVCVAVAVVMLACTLFLFINKSNNRVSFIGGKAMIWIMTSSMDPQIEEQSYIRIEKVTADEVRVGDVITFYSDDPTIRDQFNTHKVVAIIGEGESREFVTRGVNPAIPVDETCTEEEKLLPGKNGNDPVTAKAHRVVGRYVRTMPVMTALMRFFLKPYGLVCVLLLIAALTLAMSVPDFVKYFKEKKAREEETRRAEEERLIAEEVERLKRQNQDKSDQ